MTDKLMKTQFHCPDGSYLLSHSVGRPLKSLSRQFEQDFLSPWQEQGQEPWQDWLSHIEAFRAELAQLLGGQASEFCPQANLSSALTKIIQSHPRLRTKPRILMSEQDFPSMGFALQQAPSEAAEIRFIPADADITRADVWARYLEPEDDLVFVSHVYSNTGQRAPVEAIAAQARSLGVLSLVDVAQSAGVIPLDLHRVQPDFLIGSCVKWLCGGPGAGYLWLNPAIVAACEPKDVGWFSHENPFEFDIHHFTFHETALRFWGGTPTVQPFVMAKYSLAFFNGTATPSIQQYNSDLLDRLIQALGDHVVSPHAASARSGTAIVATHGRDDLPQALKQRGVFVDQRKYGLRVSPHLYNTAEDIDRFVLTYQSLLV